MTRFDQGITAFAFRVSCQRFLKPPLLRVNGTERSQRVRIILIDLQDCAQFGLRVIQPSREPETASKYVPV